MSNKTRTSDEVIDAYLAGIEEGLRRAEEGKQ